MSHSSICTVELGHGCTKGTTYEIYNPETAHLTNITNDLTASCVINNNRTYVHGSQLPMVRKVNRELVLFEGDDYRVLCVDITVCVLPIICPQGYETSKSEEVLLYQVLYVTLVSRQ
jgi:hypothetical protein